MPGVTSRHRKTLEVVMQVVWEHSAAAHWSAPSLQGMPNLTGCGAVSRGRQNTTGRHHVRPQRRRWLEGDRRAKQENRYGGKKQVQSPGVELLPAGTRTDGQSVQGRCRRATESGSCTFLQQQRAGRCVQRTQRSSHEESPPPKTRDGQAQVAGQKRRWEESHRACPRRQTIAGA